MLKDAGFPPSPCGHDKPFLLQRKRMQGLLAEVYHAKFQAVSKPSRTACAMRPTLRASPMV